MSFMLSFWYIQAWTNLIIIYLSIKSLEDSLDVKTPSYQYRNSHYKDKTVSWLSYLYNEDSHIWKDYLYVEMEP